MRSPAFQFYPDDFRGGKAGLMTLEEVGAYVQLLCIDWSQDGFALEPERLAMWCSTTPKRFDAVWQRVSECFVLCDDGKYRNPRLQQERAKQAEWREKSSKGGRKGASTRLATVVEGVVDERLQPNGNIPFPSPTPVTAKAKATTRGTGPPREAVRSWMADYCEDFEAAYGAGSKLPIKPNVRDASDLEKEHGRAEVRARWQRMLTRLEAQYVSFTMLKKMWGQLAENAVPRAPPKKPTAADESIRNSEIAFGLNLR